VAIQGHSTLFILVTVTFLDVILFRSTLTLSLRRCDGGYFM